MKLRQKRRRSESCNNPQDRRAKQPNTDFCLHMPHSVIFRKFPQKCAPSVDRFKPIRERLQKTKKVKANAQGYSHLPTHLMVPTYRSNTNLFKKISLGTQIFIFCQIWLIENSTMSSKQILIGQLWTREGANIKKITQCNIQSNASFPRKFRHHPWR